MAASPAFPATPKLGLVSLAVSTSTAAFTTAYTAGTAGSKITSVFATSADGTARDIILAVTRSAVNYPIGRVSIAANSGNSSGTPTMGLLLNTFVALPTDNDGQPYFFLQSGDTLTVNLPVTNAGIISIVVVGADF